MLKLLIGAFASAFAAIGAASVLLLVLAAISAAPASAAAEIATLAVDANTAGNTATTVGTVDSCLGNVVANGATFDIDIIVDAVPTYDNPATLTDHTGLSTFGIDLVYDPAVLKVTANNAAMLLASGGSGYTPFSLSNSVPDTDGDFSVNEVDLSTNYDSGAGVVDRITLQAIANGHSTLVINQDPGLLGNPQILASDSIPYSVGSILNGEVFVGSACGAVTNSPTPTPTPTPIGQTESPTLSPTPTPIGQTESPTLSPTPTPIGQTESPTPSPTLVPSNTPTPTAVVTTPPVTHTPTPTATAHGAATPTPTHDASATVTPKVLPQTGGAGTGGSSDLTMLLLIMALGATLVIAAGGSVVATRNGSKK